MDSEDIHTYYKSPNNNNNGNTSNIDDGVQLKSLVSHADGDTKFACAFGFSTVWMEKCLIFNCVRISFGMMLFVLLLLFWGVYVFARDLFLLLFILTIVRSTSDTYSYYIISPNSNNQRPLGVLVELPKYLISYSHTYRGFKTAL